MPSMASMARVSSLEVLSMISSSRKSEGRSDALQRFQSIVYLERLAEVIRDTSLCGLGQSAPNPVLSTIRYFRQEYQDHVVDHRCRSGVCKSITRFVIDPQRCKACGKCLAACPTEAILDGRKKIPARINQDLCVQCGSCREVCPFGASKPE